MPEAALIMPAFKNAEQRRAFWKDNDERHYVVRRFFLFLGVLCFGMHIILDYSIGGMVAENIVFWRACGTAIMFFLACFFTIQDRPFLSDNMTILLVLAVDCAAILAMLIEAQHPIIISMYPLGLMIVLGFGASILALPAMHVLVLVSLTFAGYWFLSLTINTPPISVMILIFFMSIGCFSIIIGSYVRERLERLQYISEIKLAETAKDAELARDEAIEAKRHQSYFISSMSHELRTPLNAIIGFAQAMEAEIGGPLSDNYKEYSGLIHSAGNNLLQNINDLLDLQRLESGKMSWENQRFDLRSLLNSAAALCEKAVSDADLSFVVEGCKTPIEIFADEGRVRQAITNLITNSAKFTDAGGTIKLGARQSPQGDLEIYVTDNGIGISPDDLKRIKQPFQQAGNGNASIKKEGLGLGLAIISGILDHVDGSLFLDSEVGEGTTATITIPLCRLYTPEHTPNEALILESIKAAA